MVNKDVDLVQKRMVNARRKIDEDFEKEISEQKRKRDQRHLEVATQYIADMKALGIEL